jgi:hypothetical protein
MVRMDFYKKMKSDPRISVQKDLSMSASIVNGSNPSMQNCIPFY